MKNITVFVGFVNGHLREYKTHKNAYWQSFWHKIYFWTKEWSNFRKFKVALNPMYRIYLDFAKSYILSCLSKVYNKKKINEIQELSAEIKDVRAHCYCASLVRTLYMTWRVPRHVFQARAPSRNSTKYRADGFAVTWSANIFVGCSVTPTFFSADHFLLWFFPLY